MSWTIDLTAPPPMRMTKRGWSPNYYCISKNGRIHKGNRSFWSRDAKKWARDLSWLVLHRLNAGGHEAGEGTYKIQLQLRPSDRRRRDVQNFVDFISDVLEKVLECDDSRFLFETLPTARTRDADSGIRLVITKTEP